MKKYLLILSLLFLGCSEDKAEELPDYQYAITIRDTCRPEDNSTTTAYCVTEAEYNRVRERVNNFPAGPSIGCEFDVTFTDKKGNQHTGWYTEITSHSTNCN